MFFLKKFILYMLLFFSLLASCRKEDTEPVYQLTPEMARDSLYYIMRQWYYWYKLMPSVNREDYADPYELLEAMKYTSLDRWSFVADYEEFNALLAGSFVGHGFRIGLDDAGVARIALLYNKSPLYEAGVRRGWIVKQINGQDIAPVLLSRDTEAYNSIVGPAAVDVTNTFLFKKPDGTEITISSTKTSFTINTVILYDTLHLSSGITGHLVFESFITPSEAELATAFKFFKDNNVKDLILDLRYNSGGDPAIAQTLSSYIAGNGYAGSVFLRLIYNDKNQYANSSYPFKSTSFPLALPRLVVITSPYTASASEAVINGLKNILDLVMIGETTDGKPTGMNGWPVGKKYFFWPVTFKMVNAQNEGDFYDGFTPAKTAEDDIKYDFDDRNEACLQEAISFLQTGAFTTKGISGTVPSFQFDEKPDWFNNTFVRK